MEKRLRYAILYKPYGVTEGQERVTTLSIKLSITPYVKHRGKSVMAWGCISASGDIIKTDEILNAEKYGQNLIHVISPGKQLIDSTFQHDNDPNQ